MRNLNATAWTIFRRALLCAAGAVIVWAGAVFFRFNSAFVPNWPSFFSFVICGAVVGAILEWQLPPDWDK